MVSEVCSQISIAVCETLCVYYSITALETDFQLLYSLWDTGTLGHHQIAHGSILAFSENLSILSTHQAWKKVSAQHLFLRPRFVAKYGSPPTRIRVERERPLSHTQPSL